MTGLVWALLKLNFQGTLLPTQVFAKDLVEKKSGCIHQNRRLLFNEDGTPTDNMEACQFDKPFVI